MKRYVLLTLKIVGGLVGVLLIVLIVATFVVNSASFQKKVMDYSTNLLSEKLGTKVSIDSISVNLFTFTAHLQGVDVEDQQQRKMLQADRLSASVSLGRLLRKHVEISDADVDGVRAWLYKPEDGPANYQFVLDSLKSGKPKAKEPAGQKKKSKFTLDISSLTVSAVNVVFNEDTFSLGTLKYSKSWLGGQKGEIRNLTGKLDQLTKKGERRTNRVSLARLIFSEKDSKPHVVIDSLHHAVDNHQPRKNTGKPNRGFFDMGHLDMIAHLEMTVNHYGKDTANVTLNRFEATDSVTGFNVKDLRFQAGINKEMARLSDVIIQQESTVLTFDSAQVQLPSKKAGRRLTYQTSLISGKTLLKDISRPFAPALRNFKIPVELKVRLSGTDSTMQFTDIHVNTADQRLALNAVGGIRHLTDKDLLRIQFHVKDMVAKGNVAQDIINQFVVKKFMMKQLKALGTIRYTGDILIIKKKEAFSGQLRTGAGVMTFSFALDENRKYITGDVKTSDFRLGQVLGMKDIGSVVCKADFNIDFSKPRTAAMRKKLGGKLPIGKVNATVDEASYKRVKMKHLKVWIESNGAEAKGNVSQDNKNMDWACDFWFTNTDALQNIKIKPRLSWNGLLKKKDTPPEEKLRKQQEKEAKKARKEAEKQQKAAEKAAKKAQKAAEKAARKAAKEAAKNK